MIDYPKAGMHAPVLGQMYSLETKGHGDKAENVERQRKEMVSGFLHCEDREYDRILDALGARIYIRASVYSMEMMRRGSTSSRVVMGLVDCINVDSDSYSEIEAYPENCGA